MAGVSPVDRRVVLKRVGLLLVCSAAVPSAACGPDGEGHIPRNLGHKRDDEVDTPELLTGQPVLDASTIAVGQVLYWGPLGIFLARDDVGIYAMSAFCTHAQCNIGTQMGGGCGIQNPDDVTQGFHCCCHGSNYDGNGQVTGGPATLDLTHYKTVVDLSGMLWVDTNTVVDSMQRATAG